MTDPYPVDVSVLERLRRQRIRQTLTHLSRTGELPALPGAASAALSLASSPDASIGRVCELVETDVGLAARVLRLANSAAYARRSPARTVRDAVVALGLRKTCDVLVAACFRRLVAIPGDLAQNLWSHALAVAIATEEFAKITKAIEPGSGFLPGLFHDVGRIAFLLADPTSADVIQSLVDSGAGSRADLEREWYGFDHAEAGAILAADWGLDATQADAIRWHHDPLSAQGGRPLAILLSAADSIAYAIGYGTGVARPNVDGLDALGLSTEVEADCATRVQQAFAEHSELFG
jgi:HD-like signal output (HDOD) protein